MEYSITRDDLKILLLKCIGGKYSVKIISNNNDTRSAFIRGFADVSCSIVMVSNEPASIASHMEIDNVMRIETSYLVTLDRLKGRVFNVNDL